MSFHPNQRVRGMALAAAVAAALSLTACGDKQEGAVGPAGAAQNQPPTVGVITVQPSTVLQTVELPGRLESMRVAEVRARVDGVVQRVYFAEGSDVRAGQPLFQIGGARAVEGDRLGDRQRPVRGHFTTDNIAFCHIVRPSGRYQSQCAE